MTVMELLLREEEVVARKKPLALACMLNFVHDQTTSHA